MAPTPTEKNHDPPLKPSENLMPYHPYLTYVHDIEAKVIQTTMSNYWLFVFSHQKSYKYISGRNGGYFPEKRYVNPDPRKLNMQIPAN